ncbi:MAG TPA: hypothetical protein VFW24_05480 [Acidimicrobiales bacterium]|nr:hypothetical protein [Acidimicrobiales bacterium]
MDTSEDPPVRPVKPGPRVLSLSLFWERLAQPLLISVMVAIAVAIVAGGGAAAVAHTRPATYRSQAILLMDQPVAIAASGNEGVIVKLSDLRQKYVALAGTAPIVTDAAGLAALPVSTVVSDEQVTAGQNSLTLQVAGQSGNPVVARKVAGAMAQAIGRYVQAEQSQINVAAEDKLEIRIIQPAGGGVKIGPSSSRVAAIGAVTAILAWLISYSIAQMVLTRRLWRTG